VFDILTRDEEEKMKFTAVHCMRALSIVASGLLVAACSTPDKPYLKSEEPVVEIQVDGTLEQLKAFHASVYKHFDSESIKCGMRIGGEPAECKLLESKSGENKSAKIDALFYVLRGSRKDAFTRLGAALAELEEEVLEAKFNLSIGLRIANQSMANCAQWTSPCTRNYVCRYPTYCAKSASLPCAACQ
jgi:hypothetical protein